MPTHSVIRVKFSNTPTPLPPAPRRVWIPAPVLDFIWTSRVFLLLLALLSVPVLGTCVFFINWARAGENIPGVVVQGQVFTSRKHGDVYAVTYQFPVGDRTLSDSQDLPPESYMALSPWKQTPVVVRYYAWGSLGYSELVEPVGGDPRVLTGAAVYFAVLWTAGFVALFYWIGYVPLREYATYCYGRVTTGVVISKADHSGKEGENYVVTFKFIDESGRKIFREVTVDRNGSIGADVGDEVTVVYDPLSPRRWSFCYEIGEMFVKNASVRALRSKRV